MKQNKTNSKVLFPSIPLDEAANASINEGIDFDIETKTVSYNPFHEENVDTSVENNPTQTGEIVENITVWSIFKRKRGERGDGNRNRGPRGHEGHPNCSGRQALQSCQRR